MTDQEIKDELAYFCENAGRIAPLIGSGLPAAEMLANHLLICLQVRFLGGVGAVMNDDVVAFKKRLHDAAAFTTGRAMEMMRVLGPKLWEQWHRRAYSISHASYTGLDEAAVFSDDTIWLQGFIAQIPCGDCKNHFLALLKEFPPVWGRDYFGYTVFIHNQVNEKVRPVTQAQMTVPEALTRWGAPPIPG